MKTPKESALLTLLEAAINFITPVSITLNNKTFKVKNLKLIDRETSWTLSFSHSSKENYLKSGDTIQEIILEQTELHQGIVLLSILKNKTQEVIIEGHKQWQEDPQ